MKADWMDCKPHVATEQEASAKWGGIGFACALCGNKFNAGDTFRFVYMNGTTPSPGNFLVCPACDEPDLVNLIRSALSRHKSHMKEWVLLFILSKTESAFRQYAEWESISHEGQCEGDDTCECPAGKIRDSVNGAFDALRRAGVTE